MAGDVCVNCGRPVARYAAWLDDFDGACAANDGASDARLNCLEVSVMNLRAQLKAAEAGLHRAWDAGYLAASKDALETMRGGHIVAPNPYPDPEVNHADD